MQISSINYSWQFESVKIHKHCLYWKVFSADIYRNIFSTVCCFFSYICYSVNCMSWVSKFNNFFLTFTETEARFILEGFKYCPLWKLHSHFRSPILFFAFFFILSVNCPRDFFSHFCQSVNCMSWAFES